MTEVEKLKKEIVKLRRQLRASRSFPISIEPGQIWTCLEDDDGDSIIIGILAIDDNVARYVQLYREGTEIDVQEVINTVAELQIHLWRHSFTQDKDLQFLVEWGDPKTIISNLCIEKINKWQEIQKALAEENNE
jgi:hypothetical protein